MAETNMEKNIISEEDLEKAAISGGVTKEQLITALTCLGIGVVVGAAGSVIAQKVKNKTKSRQTVPPHVYVHPLSPYKTVLVQPGDKGFQTTTPVLLKDFKLDD